MIWTNIVFPRLFLTWLFPVYLSLRTKKCATLRCGQGLARRLRLPQNASACTRTAVACSLHVPNAEGEFQAQATRSIIPDHLPQPRELGKKSSNLGSCQISVTNIGLIKLGLSIRLSMFELRETGDWDIFLGPPERARAETGGANKWVKAKGMLRVRQGEPSNSRIP